MKKLLLIFTSIVLLCSCTTKRYIISNYDDNIDNATLITIAFPEEIVRTTEALYSKLLPLIGMGRQGYSRAGHVGMVLVRDGSNTFEYYDLGRYIAKKGYARARSSNTDPEIAIPITVTWRDGKIDNIEELLSWMHDNRTLLRGYGDIYASICEEVNYERVINYIMVTQDKGIIKYGPFVRKGTNCSRFVADAMLSGVVDEQKIRKIKRLYRITPSVLGNVESGNSYDYYYIASEDSVRISRENLMPIQKKLLFDWGKGYGHISKSLSGTLNEPIHNKKDDSWQWLGGIIYGVWYDIEETDMDMIYRVTQYCAEGDVNWSELFQSNNKINLTQPYKFDYPSHYDCITINTNNKSIKLVRKR